MCCRRAMTMHEDVDRGDLERGHDIEQLRRIALAQQAQIQQLIEIISRAIRVIEKLCGTSGDCQLAHRGCRKPRSSTLTTVRRRRPSTGQGRRDHHVGEHHCRARRRRVAATGASPRATYPRSVQRCWRA